MVKRVLLHIPYYVSTYPRQNRITGPNGQNTKVYYRLMLLLKTIHIRICTRSVNRVPLPSFIWLAPFLRSTEHDNFNHRYLRLSIKIIIRG